MGQLLVRDLSPDVIEHLKQRAKRNHRSLQAEVKAALEDLAERDRKRLEAIAFAKWMRAHSPRQTTDSVDLIRQDRER
jgi:plasmid stability protein